MTFGYCTYIWVPLFTFPTVQAPEFKHGYPASVAFIVALWALTLFAMWSQRGRAPQAHEEEVAGGGRAGEKEREKEGSEGSVKSAYAVTAATTDFDGNLVGH